MYIITNCYLLYTAVYNVILDALGLTHLQSHYVKHKPILVIVEKQMMKGE